MPLHIIVAAHQLSQYSYVYSVYSVYILYFVSNISILQEANFRHPILPILFEMARRNTIPDKSGLGDEQQLEKETFKANRSI